MSQKIFSDALVVGRSWELKLATKFRNAGWWVIAAGDLEGIPNRGPRIMVPDGDSLVSPDLLIENRSTGVRYWVEVKYKNEFTFYRNAGKWQTGVDLRLFHHYQSITQSTGIPVLLYFLHSEHRSNELIKPPCSGIYCGNVDTLSREGVYDHIGDSGCSKLLYWNVPITPSNENKWDSIIEEAPVGLIYAGSLPC